MTKAYWIGIVDVKNQEEYKKYADIAGPALIKAGAKILSRGGRVKNLEGKNVRRGKSNSQKQYSTTGGF